jgi:hypothetical protein
VPDLNVELEELHASVVRAVRDRIDNGEQTNDDIRTALQLLKQNAITAQLDKDTSEQLKSQMAKKLDFSALQGKVVPLKGADQERHA